MNLIFWHRRTYQVSPADRATQLAGVGFDASVWELWPYLTAGASIHMPDEDTRLLPEKLRDWLVEHEITLSFVPTPLAEALVALTWPSKVALRAMLTGGDRLTCHVPPSLPFPLVNHYGPTEGTVVATCAVVDVESQDGKAPPIGKPIANTQAYVLDSQLQPRSDRRTGRVAGRRRWTGARLLTSPRVNCGEVHRQSVQSPARRAALQDWGPGSVLANWNHRVLGA